MHMFQRLSKEEKRRRVFFLGSLWLTWWTFHTIKKKLEYQYCKTFYPLYLFIKPTKPPLRATKEDSHCEQVSYNGRFASPASSKGCFAGFFVYADLPSVP